MKRWGKITMPLDGEPVREGHALTIVGYQDDAEAPGGGYFLVRNSWQPWAWEGDLGARLRLHPLRLRLEACQRRSAARRAISGGYARVRERDGALAADAALVRNSPDVWLRQAPDAGSVPQAPWLGQENAIYARVFNSGPACIYGVAVEVFCAAQGSKETADGELVGQLAAPMIWPGETVLGPLPWRPAAAGAVEFAVRVTAANA